MTAPKSRGNRTHPAVQGFDRAAAAYERGRPSYPEAAVRYLARTLGLRPGRTVVELGSGTGKFTRLLLPTGAAVVPVEPTRGMREEFRRQLPQQPVLDGVAEAIPVPDDFADAVVAAQAFHWFRPRPALREIERVLVQDGRLGLIWNRRDGLVDWVDRIGRIIDRYSQRIPRTRQGRWLRLFDTGELPFTRLEKRTFPFVQRLTTSELVERFLSVSRIAVQPASERRKVARGILEVVRHDPVTRGQAVVDLPYRTQVYVSRLRSGRSAR